MPASSLARAFTSARLRQLAEGRSFERGEKYFEQGRVSGLVEYEGTITATVAGQALYRVTLHADGDEVDFHCTCPVGADGAFCKHGVATALAWLDEAASASPAAKPRRETAGRNVVKLDDLQPWLREQPADRLAGWLLDAAVRDTRLREKLLREAARSLTKGVDFASYRGAIDRATTVRGFIDYHEAHAFFAGIEDAIAPLRELLAEGHATEALELTEHALRRVEALCGEVDDSDGGITVALDELQEIHHAAASAAKPDPEPFAERLFATEMSSDLGVFHGAAERYAAILGQRGLARYRALVEAEWQRLPARRPGDDEDWSPRRFHLTAMMEALARERGDLDALIAVKSRDLSTARRFLEIATLCREAKRPDDALAWAERGHRAFAKTPHASARLVEFLADEYHRRRRHDDALALIWAEFDRHPHLAAYQALKAHADRVRPRRVWPAWRERALQRLREDFARETKRAISAPRDPWSSRPDHSRLVEIFLWEGDAAAAWREAQSGGCFDRLWLALARAREKAHPTDALPIFQRLAEAQIALKNNAAYSEAVKLLTRARTAFRRLKRDADWQTYLTRLRTEHRRCRNFLALATKL